MTLRMAFFPLRMNGFTLVGGGKTAGLTATVGNLPGIGTRITKDRESDDPLAPTSRRNARCDRVGKKYFPNLTRSRFSLPPAGPTLRLQRGRLTSSTLLRFRRDASATEGSFPENGRLLFAKTVREKGTTKNTKSTEKTGKETKKNQ